MLSPSVSTRTIAASTAGRSIHGRSPSDGRGVSEWTRPRSSESGRGRVMNALGGQMGLTGYYDTRDSTKPAFDAGLKMNKVDIPSAFQALTTVQMLAPIAKYASGNVSTDLHGMCGDSGDGCSEAVREGAARVLRVSRRSLRTLTSPVPRDSLRLPTR